MPGFQSSLLPGQSHSATFPTGPGEVSAKRDKHFFLFFLNCMSFTKKTRTRLICECFGVKTDLSSYSLSNLLEAPLVMEFEAPSSTNSRCNIDTLVEIGRWLQILPRLLLQLLTELLPLYSSNVCYTAEENALKNMKSRNKDCVCAQVLDKVELTFQSRHAVCEFNLFATSIHSSSQVVKNQRCWLVYLLDFYFSIKETHRESSLFYSVTLTNVFYFQSTV